MRKISRAPSLNRNAMKAAAALLSVGLAACQTRTQARTVAIGTGSIGLVGGYVEHQASAGLPPLTLIVGGTIALISAFSMFMLHDEPRTLFEIPPTTWKPDASRRDSDLLAAIQRTSCLGRCATYTVAIYRDGFVEYRGVAHVRTVGPVAAQLSSVQLDALETALTQAKFLGLRRRYLEIDCTDLPSAFTWYRPAGGTTKSIAHYLGDRTAPAALFAIEAAIDAAVDVEQWIGTPGGPYATSCR